ncbi:hypothetical protein Ae201684_007892 [Aphanomyces euteiches]|uniref:Uncharacterized protein n=1 Tax=Aphanomyces euteiches TaxID=100861 RepID=A0A6G0X7F4_9STRA|nr:hypothetical protein Ae201684_007892 [Aphanomyces euteiches]
MELRHASFNHVLLEFVLALPLTVKRMEREGTRPITMRFNFVRKIGGWMGFHVPLPVLRSSLDTVVASRLPKSNRPSQTQIRCVVQYGEGQHVLCVSFWLAQRRVPLVSRQCGVAPRPLGLMWPFASLIALISSTQGDSLELFKHLRRA